MRILVFTEGTVVDDRKEKREWKMSGNTARKLQAWQNHGATIIYLSSKRKTKTLEMVRKVLRSARAPSGELYFRKGTEHYGETAERARPDLIVEDDCKSIGGASQTGVSTAQRGS